MRKNPHIEKARATLAALAQDAARAAAVFKRYGSALGRFHDHRPVLLDQLGGFDRERLAMQYGLSLLGPRRGW